MSFDLRGTAGSSGRRINFAFVLLFAAIAIAGMVLMVSSPSGGREVGTYVVSDSIRMVDKNMNRTAGGMGIYYFLVKAILFTGVVIVFILIVARIVRVRTGKSFALGGEINIVGRKYLSPKQYLLLVELSGKRFLLGVTENNISTLASFDLEERDWKEGEDVSGSEEGWIVERVKLRKKE